MRRDVVWLVGLLVLAAACKKTQHRDSKETLDKMADLEAQLGAKDSYIQKLRDENASLQREAAPTGGEWLFVIEGDALLLKGKPIGKARGIDDATASAMGEQFLDIVQKSRGSIQKCYEQALKKSSGLQARTIDLKLSASFATTGAFSRVSFSPELPDAFDTCLRGITAKWRMPAAAQAMTFQASVKLTPT